MARRARPDETAAEREDRLRYHREYYRANRERMSAQSRERYVKRAETIKSRARAWNAANPERAAGKRRRWAAANPERVRAYALADAHRRRGAAMDEDAKAYGVIVSSDPCSYCGGRGGEMDHIQPVVHGGNGSWQNLTAACRSCNASKSSKSLLAFLLT